MRCSIARLPEVLSEVQTRREETSVGQQAAVGMLGEETTVAKAKGVQCGWGYESLMKNTNRTLC